MRRVLLLAVAAVPVLALLNVFGQRDVSTVASGNGVTLSVKAPERIRGGDLFQGRFVITTDVRIKKPRLVLDSGWLEENQLNTLNPSPATERSRDGRLELGFAPIPAGDDFTLWTEWQVNPTNVGTRSQDAVLYDGHRQLAAVSRDVTVFP